MGEYSSLYEKIRKKNLGESTPASGKSSSGSSGGTYSSAYEKIKNAHVMRADVDPTITVDDSYISKFFDDYNRFVSSASESYKGIGYGNAGKLYDDYGQQGEDLRKRGDAIKRYLWANRDAFGDEYDSIADSIEQMMAGQRSIVDSYRATANNMNLFDSEDAYNQYVQRQQNYQDKWGHYVDAPDYEDYSARGASIKNPTMSEAERGITIFGKQIGGADVGNIVTYSRDNHERIGMGEANGSTVVGKSLYHYMTDDEVGIYNYLLAKNGSESAQAYLDDLEEDLNFRMGTAQAGTILSMDNPVVRTMALAAASVGSGVDQWGSGVRQLFSEDKLPTTSAQFGSSKIAESLDGFGREAYIAGNTIGNMAPSILLSNLTAGLGAGVKIAQGVGGFALGASAAGNAYGQALAGGYSKEQASAYGVLVGTSEGLLQYLLGGIASLGGMSGKLAGKIAAIDNSLLRIAAKMGASIGSEIMEEELQSFLEPAFRSFLFGEEYDAPTFDELLETAIVTALSTGLLEGPSNIGGDIANSRYYKSTYGESAQDLVNEGLESADGSLSKTLAQKYQEALNGGGKLNGHQLGRMVEANEQQFMAEDMTAMETAAAERLTELGETGDVSVIGKALAKQAAGEKLTRAETSAIQTSKYGQRVANEMNPNNIESGEYSTDWAQQIGTNRVNAESYNAGLQALAEEMAGVKPTDSAPAEAGQETTTSVGDSTPKPVMPVTERFTASGEGKTSIANMGKVQIASTENGKMTLKTESGQTVKAEDVSFRSEDEAMVYSAVLDMGVSPVVAQSIVDNFDGTDGRLYAEDVKLAYQYGKMNFPKSYLEKLDIKPHQAEHAYNLGRSDAKAEVFAPKTKRTVKGKRGTVTFETAVDESTLKPIQRESLNGIKAIADLSGLNVHVFMSDRDNSFRYTMPDGAVTTANGWYIPGTNEIWIDLNAGKTGEGTMLYTFAHEISHYIKEWSPTKWRVMADFLLEQYGEDVPLDALLQRQMDKISKRDPSLKGNALMDAAYEELVSDAMSEMLVDGEVAQKLAELKQKDRTLWEKIKEAIHNLLERWGLIRKEYEGKTPDAGEAQFLRGMDEAFKKLQRLYTEAFAEASENFAAEQTLAEAGIAVNAKTDSGSLFSVRDVLSEADRKKVAKALADRFAVTEIEAMEWLKAETSLSSLILNPKYSMYLDYEGDPNEVAIKQNSDYPQGTVDFSNICKKRREFTQVMNRVLRNFPHHVFAATDLAKIRTIMGQEGMTLPCGICYVEDRRQLDSIVAQDFIDGLKLYREGSKTRPDGKPFNANQLKGLQLTDGDTYVPSIYELVTLEGRNSLKAKNPNMEAAWVRYNNARGMQSVRLLTNEAEYKRQILKYSPKTVQSKNDHGGLRIYSFSDAEMFHLIDIVQVITDSATVGLSLQGYTKVNEYARAVRDTGEKLNRSLIPAGDLGYHIEDGKVVLDYDTVEGIDIHHEDFFDNRDNPNVGNIVIGINDTQIRAAMVSDFIDQIIPFHTGQSEDVLGEKGIAAWDNYKDFQTEKDLTTGKTSAHQINIYTEVIQAAEQEGKPIQNKRQFVEKFLAVCKQHGLKPRFAQFLNTDANGDYIYTEGYHKFLVDFKTFAQTEVGEYLPQLPVKPIFDDGYMTGLLKAYVTEQQTKDAEVAKQMPRVIERITNEIIKSGEVKRSERDAEATGQYADGVKFSERVTDKETLKFLNGQKTITTYKTMQLVDGKLYPPMAARTEGKYEDYSILGQWEQATEHPELITDGNQYKLDKGKGQGSLKAAYNPYMHSSNLVLNDQFSGAYSRPQLVTVECEVPVSELTSGYHAQYAKDSVGWHAWHTGTVAGQLRKARGIERQVFLSRWIKPVRIVSDVEVAGMYKELLDGTDIAVPDNVVTPSLLAELKKAGVKTKESGKIKMAGNVKYSERDFAEQVDEVFAGTFERGNAVYVGKTPDILQQIGLNGKLPMLTTAKHILNAIKPKDSWHHQHGLTEAQVKSLPEKIAAPVMVMDSLTGSNSIVVVTDMVDPDGSPVVVTIKADGRGMYNNVEIDTNFVTSYYGRDAFDGFIADNVAAGNILYVNRKKATALAAESNTSWFEQLKSYDFDTIVHKTRANVKLSDRDTAPTFYSHMARVVDAVKQDKLGAASVVNMLRGKGVKAEEIKWSGIEAWLEGKKSVTKAELREFIAGSMLQIEEETLSDEEIPYTKEEQEKIAKYEAERDIVAENLKSEWKRIVGTDIPITYFGAGLESAVVSKLLSANAALKEGTEAGYKYKAARAALQRVIDDSGDYFGYDTSRQAFIVAVRDPKGFLDNVEMSSFQKGVFRDYIKAKEAYGKVEGIPMHEQKALLGIAAGADRISGRISEVKSAHYAKAAKHKTKWGQYRLKGGENYREVLFRMPGATYYNAAMSNHWGDDVEGVLAHARIQDMPTAGGRMLFVEEIQSDWHNGGREFGYEMTPAEEKQRRLDLLREQKAAETELDRVIFAMDRELMEMDLAESSGDPVDDSNYRRLVVEHGALRERIIKAGVELDKLEKHRKRRAPHAPFADSYHEFVMKRLIRMAAEGGYSSIGWTTADIQSKRWSPKYAEGYRIEYDQDIPKFMSKYGKKWGAKVGKTSIETGKTDADGNPRFGGGNYSVEVWSMPITAAMKQSVLYEGQPLYSERDTDSVSHRDLLAGAFEGIAQNDIERGKIEEYRKKVKQLNEQEQKLAEIRKELGELSFAKGPRDNDKIRKLREEATKISNRIGIYDKQLLRLEASAPLMAVLEREKKLAYSRASQKWADRMETARTGRNKTEMRHKIKGIVSELNQLLLHGSKDKHVMIGLQKATAEALSAINMDTVAAEERLAKIQAKIDRATDPAEIAKLQQTYARIEEMGMNMNARLAALKNAYEDIKDSGDPLIAGAYQPEIEERIKNLRKMVGETPLRNMSMEQLEFTYDTYKMVLTTIRNANKAFKNAKGESIAVLGNRTMQEIETVGGKKPLAMKAMKGPLSFAWSGLKPAYAFKAIGSDTLSEMFENVRAGEDTWAVDVSEAKEFYRQKTQQYHFDSWDMEKQYTFTSKTGKEFKLTLEQIMSLYAYSKRKQADAHLDKGGFVFDDAIEVVQKKHGIPVKYTVKTADAHNLSRDTLMAICKTLTDEQVKFVDEMQEYLSTVMGEKGNEVSLEMYGVKLFKEKFYFPLKSAKQYMFEQNEVAGEVKIKNSGFSKETVQHASNPVILSNFTEVWASHVNDMAMYHAFVLPLEDFNRVFNYKTPNDANLDTESVKMFLQNAYGRQPEQYIRQLLTDLNGGARSDPNAGIINKLIGIFKKSAVFASMSVVVQQPSAIARAAAYIDTKYFVGKPSAKSWDEVKKYAPVAIIKEMGYFDTNMGVSTTEFIKAKEYHGAKAKMAALVTDSQYRDEILSKAPAVADELAWCQIWEAVKKETAAKGLKGEELLQAAGKRFTEVIVNTQVYDSVLSRSGMMRSKDTGVKMATSFMAEPTTSLNMITDALIQGKRGNKSYARKAIGSVIASMILNSILVSFVYAGRDDDEDKTYAEKYVGTLTGELIDSFNPLTMIPFVKDIVSIAQGYDVERSDMAVVTDLYKAWKNLSNENRSTYRKVEDFGGAVAAIFGLPVKNIMRDLRGMYNTVMSFVDGNKTTGRGVGEAARENLPKLVGGGERSNSDELYHAMLRDDAKHTERVKARFKDERAVAYAIRDGLVANDKRITAAAEARVAGNQSEYLKLAREITGEGHFSQDDVVRAINYVTDKLRKGETESASSLSAPDTFKVEDYYNEVVSNDQAEAEVVKREIISGMVADGKTAEEAEKSFNNSFKNSAVKPAFIDGDIAMDRAIAMLQKYGGLTEDAAAADVEYWAFSQNYPNIPVEDSWFDAYYKYAADVNIPVDTYMTYRNDVRGITGDGKKARRMAVIDSLPLTSAQKDALYYSEGWAASTIWEAPWH